MTTTPIPQSVSTDEALAEATIAVQDAMVDLQQANSALLEADSALQRAASQIHAERQGTADGAEFGRPTQSTLSQGEAWDAAHNRHYGPVESFAAELYARFEYAAGRKPDWVPHGNSLKQDEARYIARRQLHDLGHTPGVTEHLRNEAAPGAAVTDEQLGILHKALEDIRAVNDKTFTLATAQLIAREALVRCAALSAALRPKE